MDYKYSQNRKNILFVKSVMKTVMILLLFITLFYFNANAQDDEIKFEMSASKYLMGTEFVITVVHTSIDSGKKAMYYALREVKRIENVMSNYRDSSEISYVNKNAFLKPVKVSSELFGIIERSISYSKRFDGYFDITVGPLTNYWGFNSDHPIQTEPDKNKIKECLEFVDYKYIKLNYEDSTISFTKNGVGIDLGGIAKGYALDRAVEVLRKRGVNDFLINGGGDIYASGRKADGKKWVVGIKDPRNNEALLEVFEVENTGVLTSGDYERFEIINGKRYHHIFNSKTGFPSETSQSATVILNNCEYGVVLSKILFITGTEYIKYFEDLPYYQITGNSEKQLNVQMKNMIDIRK
ncbi:MAG: FAD:protein FMN transferase [Ignavibacteria bacterium]|jgi:thiamine biosynthesis lipoprotein